jgi:hypothetical protein
MAEIKEFVVNDRRKFTETGDVRPDAPPSEPKAPRPEVVAAAEAKSATGPQAVPDKPAAEEADLEPMPPPPTAEQTADVNRAYTATVDRLDTAIRATNPGMEPIPEMNFTRVIQSIYMQALLQMGAAAEPGQQQPRVDILGARQTIDMLTAIASKTTGNLSEPEQKLLDAALFELRMGFLELTQAMARQAQASQQPGAPGTPSAGPTIVR